MKNIYLTLVFLLFGFLGLAQISPNDSFEETTIIKRIDNETPITPAVNKTLLSAAMSASSAPTGTSGEVGVTEGQLSVSLNGNANYSIPIALPKGINSVEPQFKLQQSEWIKRKCSQRLGYLRSFVNNQNSGYKIS